MLNTKKMQTEVVNVTDGEERFVVARRCEDGRLWYWGRYFDPERAQEVAEEIGGIVLEDESN